jgi:ABC-type lipoprotein export system ATPase subunit
MKEHTIVDLMGELTVPALQGVSLQVKQGEAIGIMGPSGSGKTTLLNLIGALDRPTSGTVTIDGVNITSMNEKELTTVRRNKISFVFQFFNLLPVLSAYENVELPLLIAGVEETARKERVDHLIGLVGLTERAEHRLNTDRMSSQEENNSAWQLPVPLPSLREPQALSLCSQMSQQEIWTSKRAKTS